MKSQAKIITALSCLFCGCMEYEEYYEYSVENKLTDTATVNLTIGILNSTYTIPPNETRRIHYEPGGISGKYDHPSDIREKDNAKHWRLDSVGISVKDSLIGYNFANPLLWTFTTKQREGFYTLKLTNELLKDLEE